MKVVIDTSIIVDYLRGGQKWEEFLTSAEKDLNLFIPTIVIFELFSGQSTKNSNVRTIIENFIDQFERIDLTESLAKSAGQLRSTIGIHISPQDYIIAASALDLGAKVLTLNKKHFEQIPNLTLYPLYQS